MKRKSLANLARTARVIPLAVLVLSLFSFQNSSEAQIVLSVMGGTGNTPLTLSITTGATFTANGASITTGVFFDNLFNNSNSVSDNTTTSFNSISLGGNSDINGRSLGTWTEGDTDQNDLFAQWSLVMADNDSVILSTGTRVSNNLSLDYSSISGSGSAYLMDPNGFIKSDAGVTYTVVPEPSTYAAVSGVLLIGIAALRRRTLARP